MTTVPVMDLSTLSDADLLRLMRSAADQCVAVMAMSHEDRHRVGKKGEASAWEAGAFSAVVALRYAREAERRGIDSGLAEAQ